MTLKGLIKMKCCVVGIMCTATALLLIFGNLIFGGITGTLSLLFGIGLLLLIGIAAHDFVLGRQAEGPTPTEIDVSGEQGT
jgi:hypothetical protein